MEKKKWILWGAVGLACLLIAVILAYYLDYLPIREPVNLKMQAYEVTIQGEIQETISLEVKGNMLHYWERLDRFDGDIIASDSYRYILHGGRQNPYLQSSRVYEKLGAFVSTAFVYDKPNNSMTVCDFALDTNNDCIILRLQEENGVVYLVGSADPNTDPQELLKHFAWFLQ